MMVRIDEVGRALDDADVVQLERRLGVSLPEAYRSFLLRNNGGRPSPDTIDVDGVQGGLTDIKVFFGIDRSFETSTLEWNLKTLSDRLPRTCLPIASDSGGNRFTITLEGSGRGKVVYWVLDAPVISDHVVAPDFTAFLEKIRPFE